MNIHKKQSSTGLSADHIVLREHKQLDAHCLDRTRYLPALSLHLFNYCDAYSDLMLSLRDFGR